MDFSACGTLSPSDSVAAGPVGPDGPLSSSDLAGVLFPAVPAGIPFPVGPAGPVGLDGTLSPSNFVSGVLVDPGGMLPSSDLAGILLPAVSAGMPLSVGPVGPVGLCGTQSPSDYGSVGPVGPVGPYGTLSPFESDSFGSVGLCGMLSPPDPGAEGPVGPGGTLSSPDPAVPAGILLPVGSVGPVGPCGMLSPSDSESAILVDPGGVFPSSDLAGMRGPAPPAESAFLMGPVGPAMSLGVLPLSDSESADPAMPTRMQYSSIVELVGPLGPVETLFPGEHGPGLCPIGLTVGLLPVAAVPLPAVRDPMIALSTVEGLERDCAEVGEESITVYGGPDVAKTPAVVAMMGMGALPMRSDAPLDCADECPAWDSGYQREIIDDMTVYYGDDLYDSAFRNGLGSFPSGADDPQPMVVFNGKLFSDDVLADTSVSVREEVPVLALQILTDKRVPLVTPVVDQDVRRIKGELFSQDEWTDEVWDFPCQYVVC